MSESVVLGKNNFDQAFDRASQLINSGGVGVIAAEHGYLYVANAFDEEAVNRIHTLRGDPEFRALQVIVGSVAEVTNLAEDFDTELMLVASEFWPGMLSIYVQTRSQVNWDLGDHGESNEFAVRIPSRTFLRTLAQTSGPLAVASAAIAGSRPTGEINFVPALASQIAIYIDEGELASGPPSTILRRKVLGAQGGLEVVREGAITLKQLQKVLPTLHIGGNVGSSAK